MAYKAKADRDKRAVEKADRENGQWRRPGRTAEKAGTNGVQGLRPPLIRGVEGCPIFQRAVEKAGTNGVQGCVDSV